MQSLILAAEGGYQAFEFTSTEWAWLIFSAATAILAGVALQAPSDAGKPAVNAAVLIDRGNLLLEQHKRLLPFYDVFDEQRYFSSAESRKLWKFGDDELAITICEDAWNDKNFWPNRLYKRDPVEELTQAGGTLIINISASPYFEGKRELRQKMLSAIAERHHAMVLMVNQVGGNDSLVFDGSSFAMDSTGAVYAGGPDGLPVISQRSFSAASG
jgi:predicted amidohydrolase